MTIDDQIRDEKLQYDINREAAKISALSSGKTDMYGCLTDEEILPSSQQQIIEEAKFTYSPLGKVDALKSLESSDKQLPSIKDFILKERLNLEIIDEIERIEDEERKAGRSKIVYKGFNETYDFRRFKTVHVFGSEIRNSIINMSMANDEQTICQSILENLKVRQDHKEDVLNSAMALLKRREMTFKAFESRMSLNLKELEQ